MIAGTVIVTHNSGGHIGACLDSVQRWIRDVVVVDNASEDGTREEVRRRPGMRLIANDKNRGFAGGVNQGVAALNSDCVLLLNPDAELLADPEPLLWACSTPGVGAAAGLLVGEDGRPQRGFTLRRFPTPAALAFEALGLNRLWPSNPVNRRYRCLDLDLSQAAEAEQPAGAFLMIRRDVWEELGGLDEGFHPVWFEDVDLLRRMAGRGYRIQYCPAVPARHRGGHSVLQLDAGQRGEFWYASLLRYSEKHFRRWHHRIVCGAVALGCTGRLVTGMLSDRGPRPLRGYGRVVRLAGGGVFSRRRSAAQETAVQTRGASAVQR